MAVQLQCWCQKALSYMCGWAPSLTCLYQTLSLFLSVPSTVMSQGHGEL